MSFVEFCIVHAALFGDRRPEFLVENPAPQRKTHNNVHSSFSHWAPECIFKECIPHFHTTRLTFYCRSSHICLFRVFQRVFAHLPVQGLPFLFSLNTTRSFQLVSTRLGPFLSPVFNLSLSTHLPRTLCILKIGCMTEYSPKASHEA